MSRNAHLLRVPYLAAIVLVVVVTACAAPAPGTPTALTSSSTAAAPASSAPTVAPAPTAAAAIPTVAAAAPTAAAVASTAAVPAKVTEYNITRLTDMSGPTVANAKLFDPGVKVAIAYWNDTAGKALGVKLNQKAYDARYDATVTASLWPAVLATDKPIAAVAEASPNLIGLSERLAGDKVTVHSGSIAVNSFWRPNQWIFIGEPTFAHQIAGFLSWRTKTWTENRPIRIGMIASQQSPSSIDMLQGTQKFLESGLFAGKVEFAGVEYMASLTPTDASSEVKRLLDKKTDYIIQALPVAVVVAIKRALQQYKADTKMLFFGNSPVDAAAKAMTMPEFEGDYEVSSLASLAETGLDGPKIYDQYKDKVEAADIAWSGTTAVGMLAGLLPLRGIERAARTVGADKITGESVYNAMFAGTITSKDLLGISGDLSFTKEAPFPTSDPKVRISIVKDGKYQLATPDWVAAPAIPKW